jgi:hypothetical protein
MEVISHLNPRGRRRKEVLAGYRDQRRGERCVITGKRSAVAHYTDGAVAARSLRFLTGLASWGVYNNSIVSFRKRTVSTERPPLVGEVIANFCG